MKCLTRQEATDVAVQLVATYNAQPYQCEGYQTISAMIAAALLKAQDAMQAEGGG